MVSGHVPGCRDRVSRLSGNATREDKLYLAAREAMRNPDQAMQRMAREKFMLPYLERFPEGEYHAEMQQWSDQIQVDILEAQADRKARSSKEPRDEFEAAFVTALQLERDVKVNPLEAIEAYQQLRDRYKSNPEATHWCLLAKRHQDALFGELMKRTDREQIIADRMMVAEQQLSAGKNEDAQRIWGNCYEVFSGVRELEEFHLYARRRMNGEPFQIPTPKLVAPAAESETPAAPQSEVPSEQKTDGTEG